MKKHKIRNILLMTLGLIVISVAVCGYIFRREIKFYYYAKKAERFFSANYGVTTSNQEDIAKKNYSPRNYKVEDTCVYFNKENAQNISELLLSSVHMDKEIVSCECISVFQARYGDFYREDTDIIVDLKSYLYKNNDPANAYYDRLNKTFTQKYKQNWSYPCYSPPYYTKATMEGRCFFQIQYPKSLFNDNPTGKIVLTAEKYDDDSITQSYYKGEYDERFDDYIEFLESIGINVPEEFRQLPDEFPKETK